MNTFTLSSLHLKSGSRSFYLIMWIDNFSRIWLNFILQETTHDIIFFTFCKNVKIWFSGFFISVILFVNGHIRTVRKRWMKSRAISSLVAAEFFLCVGIGSKVSNEVTCAKFMCRTQVFMKCIFYHSRNSNVNIIAKFEYSNEAPIMFCFLFVI